MRCIKPRTVGFHADGKTICWSPKKYSKEFAPFQLPCGKCIECRLQYGMEWALRSVKEASMHEDNCFITLTYSDENLGDNKLDYSDFQLFIKRLRYHIHTDYVGKDYWESLNEIEQKNYRKEHKDALEKIRISVFCTGEYGKESKRKHWHALIFNWRPKDGIHFKTSSRGDQIYTSSVLDNLWGKGHTNFGDVTIESASYCARYAAKKLSHGWDGEHGYEPISRKSSKNAIGKSWLEKYWKNVFDLGYVHHDGVRHGIPRYFEKWFKKHKPELFDKFVFRVKAARLEIMVDQAAKNEDRIKKINEKRSGLKGPQVTESDHKRIIADKKLQYLKEKELL